MLARVVTFEGGNADEMRSVVGEIEGNEGPPEGVPSVGFTLLVDYDGGKTIAIGFFEDEDKLRQGDAVLNEMSPPGGSFGQRKSVDVYEVGRDVRM
jgi:hypothetical protein